MTQKAPTKSSGGGGFEFADKVAAMFFADMLGGRFPLGPRFGPISEIHFEVRDRKWLLDDLLLVSNYEGAIRHAALSLKSNTQVTRNGFPSDFTTSVWDQWKGQGSSIFNQDSDLLCLGISRLGTTIQAAWDQLLIQAVSTDPQRLIARLVAEEGQSSEIQRNLFESLHCPPKFGASDPSETACLLKSVRLLIWDFASEPSTEEAHAILFCRTLLVTGDSKSALGLWDRLQKIASESRAAGASHDLGTLLRRLGGEFEFHHHPDFRNDWLTLQTVTEETKATIRNEVGSGIRIARNVIQSAILEALVEKKLVTLRGESGVGKSALVAGIADGWNKGPVVWIDGIYLDYPNRVEIATALKLQHPLFEVLNYSSPNSGLLVLDSLERFSLQALRRAGELLRFIHENMPGWSVAVTCQSFAWEAVIRELFAAGFLPKHLFPLDIEAPSVAEIVSAVGSSLPAIRPYLLRNEFQTILRNLKVLDWVVTEDALRNDLSHQSFVGETDLIEWIWKRWIGDSTDQHARASLLVKIAEYEGQSIGLSVQATDLNDDERGSLGKLEKDRLLRITRGNVQFTHDMLGDWGRLQSLIQDEKLSLIKIEQRIHLPRWQRAVRLFAQRILEHPEGAGKWKEALNKLPPNSVKASLAADSFLDALIFAGNAENLVEQVWPELTANKGSLLRRYLKRFLHIATIPDFRVADIATVEDLDWVFTKFRIPNVMFWYGPLRVLERHASDVCKLSLVLAAEFCDLWLRTIPKEWGGRSEAARLAIMLAREAQGLRAEEVFFYDEADHIVYEALLHAAPDLPDEACTIALELCNRRDSPPEIVERARKSRAARDAEFDKRAKDVPRKGRRRRPDPLAMLGTGWEGALREPAEDGPRRQVDRSFRRAALDGTALVSLAQVRPEIAREIVLAVCIDEPKPLHRDHDVLSQDFGTSDWYTGYPPMFFRGPFLQFLRSQPDEGLETIIRLVNYSTERWAERYLNNAPPDLDPDFYSLEFTLPEKKIRWIGVPNVFVWYRGMLIGSNSIASALMALEKWLYEELDQGRNVDKWLELIWNRSSSVAFAGVLVAVGLRTPTLLCGSLRPLLSAWPIYNWQLSLTLNEGTWTIGLVSWHRFGEKAVEQVTTWNKMDHRQYQLRKVAIQMMLTNPEMTEFYGKQCESWSELLKKEPIQDLEILIAVFDKTNYFTRDLDDQRVSVEFNWPESLRERMEASGKSFENKNALLLFPHLCRQLLDGERILTPEEVEDFWQKIQALQNVPPLDDHETKLMDSQAIVTGGIAVLFKNHRSWLKKYPDRESWCLNQLRAFRFTGDDDDYSSRSVLNTNTEGFVAEAAVHLMCESPDEWVRELFAESLMGRYYSSTRTTLTQSFEQRAILAADFDRSINLLICWAGLRLVIARCGSKTDKSATFRRVRQRLIRAFVQKTISRELIDFRRISAMSQRAIKRLKIEPQDSWAAMRRSMEQERSKEAYREPFWLDVEVIYNGFGFLGPLSVASDVTDRRRLISYASATLNLFLGTMPPRDDEREVDGTPYDFDRWTLKLATAFAVQLPPASPEARLFWQPIMDLGPGAHYWVEDFCSDWFTTGINFAPSLETFASSWHDLLTYTLNAPIWGSRTRYSYRAEKCLRELMGLGITTNLVSQEDFVPVLISIQPLYKQWADQWLASADSLAAFAYFLTKPAGRAFMPTAVVWLNAAAQDLHPRAWEERHLIDALVGSLRRGWRQYSTEISTDSTLHQSFLDLLNRLCILLNEDALALRTLVSEAGLN